MFLALLGVFACPHLCHFSLLPSNLSVILCILFLNLHEDASELDALIEVLKDLLLNSTNLLTFLDLTAGADLSLLPDEGVP